MMVTPRLVALFLALLCGSAATSVTAQHPSEGPAPQPLIITPVESRAEAVPAAPDASPKDAAGGAVAATPVPAASVTPSVALLLPASGKLAEAGQALREGVVQGYYAHVPATAQPLQLRFYVVDSPEDARARYDQAVSDGAKAIIGPVQKEAVAALAASGELGVPVLALNVLPAGQSAPASLYQFALEPEEEVGQVAERVALDGLLQVFVVTASGAYNNRLSEAFRPRLIAAGGSVVEELKLGASNEEWTGQIKRAFKVKLPPKTAPKPAPKAAPPGSAEAAEAPAPVLHREDVNAIFFAGNGQQLRQFMLYLDFHRIALPVFSTSQVWSGRRLAQAGVGGAEFPDAPFMLDDNPQGLAAQALALWPASTAKYPRLVAMGLDAWELALRLSGIKGHPADRVAGATGELKLDANRRVQRQLAWARLQDGTAVPAGQAPVTLPAAGPAP